MIFACMCVRVCVCKEIFILNDNKNVMLRCLRFVFRLVLRLESRPRAVSSETTFSSEAFSASMGTQLPSPTLSQEWPTL